MRFAELVGSDSWLAELLDWQFGFAGPNGEDHRKFGEVEPFLTEIKPFVWRFIWVDL